MIIIDINYTIVSVSNGELEDVHVTIDSNLNSYLNTDIYPNENGSHPDFIESDCGNKNLIENSKILGKCNLLSDLIRARVEQWE